MHLTLALPGPALQRQQDPRGQEKKIAGQVRGRAHPARTPTLRESRVDQAAAHPTPAVGVLAADHDDVSRHAQIAEGAMESHRLLSLISDLRLDDKKVDVAARVGLSASVGAEQNHLCVGGGRRQPSSRLCNQGVVNYRHDPES
jgi:hypothetical protein